MNEPALPTTASQQLVEELLAVCGSLKQENETLKAQLDWFKRQLFGQKSEKRQVIQNPDQVTIADILTTPPEVSVPAPKEIITYTRRKKGRSDNCVTEKGLRFTDDVPVEIIQENVPELQGEDADHYEVIDYKITRRLAQRPGSYVVLEYRRPVLRHKPTQTLSSPPAPAGIFDKSLADVSLLAGMLIDKFVHHLPLHRQHHRMIMSGITISRSTLTLLVKKTAELLRPIFEALLRSVLASRVVAIDETPMKVGRKEKGKMQNAWFWPVYGLKDEAVFTFSTSKSVKHLESLLENWQGVVLSDGNPVYDSYCNSRDDITLAQCWVHARRYFIKSEQVEPAATGQALALIGDLYKKEAAIRDKALTGSDKKAFRQLHAKPAVDAFFSWCQNERQRIDLTPQNPLTKAISYACNHEQQMRVFLEEPDVSPDTNHLERALRCIPMGRKNYLFCWTELGGEHVGIVQSLLVTCRLQGIDPYRYLVDVLQRISLHPARQVDDLIPRNWKERFGDNPLKAPLDK